jgi:hypothetical protein
LVCILIINTCCAKQMSKSDRRRSSVIIGGNTYEMKLIRSPMKISMQLALSSKNVTVSLTDTEFAIYSGSREILKLDYPDIPKWFISDDGTFEVQYCVSGSKKTKVLVLQAEPEVLKQCIDCLDGHIAELVVFRGLAPNIAAAKEMLRGVKIDKAARDAGIEMAVE